MKSVTVCKDSLNSRTLNANAVCATCNKCLVDSNHFVCVPKMFNDVNARTKKPTVVPISARKPKSQANKSMYKNTSKALKCVDSGCTKHMTGNLKLLCNFVEKFLELFVLAMISLRQFLVMDIWFKEMSRSTGFITSKASITISSQLVNFVMRIWRLLLGSQHVLLEIFRDIVIGLPKLKYVKDQLCSSCELSEAKRSSFKSKVVSSSKGRLNLLHMDLCGPMRVASINGKKYILVIVDDYSRYTWTLFLHADVPSQQELDLLFGPLYDEFFNAEEGEKLQDDEFTNPFYALAQEEAESSSNNIAKGYAQEEGIDFEESFTLVARLKAKYTLEILHKHSMDKGQSIGTPMAMKPKLDADLSGNPVDQTEYHSKIGSLMYLTSSRLYIVQAGSSFELTAFLDADHAECIDSRKITSGGIHFLGDKTEYQLADMFTKALPKDRFKYLVRRIGMRCLTPAELEVLAKEYA
nr:copia protein [Tanacetum cinerariifolium]